ncbi:zinc finger protein ubi-d4 B [Hyalella azteca]|uniref:Zinc finger protein ubi-d4 B n=1 Tax=Hyalella azteca TaxID=294128 RepID=A0A8B7NNR6_HYAAZ|nr:zinc finger protein ubi-d4 B [Hyalella azteca]
MAGVAVENPLLDKISSFMNDNSYTELVNSTAKFNVRIRRDRRYRQPYIDGQTGVAQRDCHLFVSVRQRQPGQQQGQIFSYPQRRWKAPHRSYLRAFVQPTPIVRDPEEHIITAVENPAAIAAATSATQAVAAAQVALGGTAGPPVVAAVSNTNGSLEPELLQEKDPWTYYEDTGFEELEEDIETDDNDDDETYDRKGRKRKTPAKKSKKSSKKKSQPKTPGGKSGGSKKARAPPPPVEDNDDPESKPYHCELCGMRYKTRPGLTYHYAHSHKEHKMEIPPKNRSSSSNASSKSSSTTTSPPPPPPPPTGTPPVGAGGAGVPPSAGVPNIAHPYGAPGGAVPSSQYPPLMGMPPYAPPHHLPPHFPTASSPAPGALHHPFRNTPADGPDAAGRHVRKSGGSSKSSSGEGKANGAPSSGPPGPDGGSDLPPGEGKKKASASPYCDFCLGDSSMNKKTLSPEGLVSCADCGRSGHPTCLQFTTNMMKSVSNYRWQCIECKTCTLCGTSENDDQLLFCDDCDRGYHLYCLAPPLAEPPEGEWSCSLCIKHFHSK